MAPGGRPRRPPPGAPTRSCGVRPVGGAVGDAHRSAVERRDRRYRGMEPCCGVWGRGRGPRTSAATHARALSLLLLLLLPRPAGCLGSEQAPGADPADPGVLCSPKATCPSDLPRLAQDSPTTVPTQPPVSEPVLQHCSQPETLGLCSTAFRTGLCEASCGVCRACVYDVLVTCGFSYEPDPTLRYPEAMARRWPWMVSVQANGTHVCAGTIIASQWVLTVAHCLIQRDVSYSVRVGSPWIDQVTQTTSDIPVLQVIVNSRYQERRYWSWVGQHNNIGLLKLKRMLQYNNYVWPICLPGLDYVLKDNSVCTVTGWGLPKADGVWPQFRTIQEKEVTIMNSKECDDFYHSFSKIPSLVQIINSKMICAKDVSREEFCYEVSGEPLVCSMEGTWYLVGMVSWGAGCQKSQAPPIYLYISSYQHWIWDRLSGQPLAMLAPSRALLLVLPLPLSLLAAL
ncbi:LOW QUALITY PROTEIN: probable threonine protease PRSS50 [Lemur catta]|uniref:LOW QUALITY PROTEIN: probable threonine protease PRSS50 n=1 Tax=Lemur catta TaxID=9447 RepID=UPI001E26D871|nr:LOW QUALITY PROTEIN: probable threonine protease PRSS50 [Lemur catta]